MDLTQVALKARETVQIQRGESAHHGWSEACGFPGQRSLRSLPLPNPRAPAVSAASQREERRGC